MPADLSRNSEVKEEGNLLIEAVALLVQRQRETESWVAEQIWQAEERSAATDRRYAELEARLEGIEEHLARLIHEIEPVRGDPAVDERLARLREQVEGLKSGPAEGHQPRGATTPVAASEPGAPSVAEPALRDPENPRPVASAEPRYERRPVAAQAVAAAGSAPNVSFWDLLGRNPQDRFGVVLIGAGAVALLFAVLTMLRFS